MNDYGINIVIEFNCFDRFLLQPSELHSISNEEKEVRERVNKCNLYLICSRPRVFPIISNSKLSCNYKIKGETKSFDIKIEDVLKWCGDDTVEVSVSGHSGSRLAFTNDESVYEVSFNSFIGSFPGIPEEIKTLHLEYIGKSNSSSLNDGPIDRLLSHSTMQKILADYNVEKPDYSIFCILLNYPAPKLIFVLKAENVIDVESEEKKRLASLWLDSLTIESYTQIVEATLINYFKPKYNSHFKDNFDVHSLKTLGFLKKHYIDSISVNLDTSMIDTKLKSDTIDCRFEHFFEKPLRGSSRIFDKK